MIIKNYAITMSVLVFDHFPHCFDARALKSERLAFQSCFIRSTIACSDNPQTLRILPIEITQVSEDLQLKIGQDCIFK